MTADDHLIITPIKDFHEAAEVRAPAARLEAMRSAANSFRARMLAGRQVRYYRSDALIRVPYPSSYAFTHARRWPMPFVHILNRLFVVQVDTVLGIKTLLLSPSDVERNRATPFFRRLAASFGPFEKLVTKLIAPQISSVEQVLARLKLRPEQIDFISYDHLHTQDLRRWLGSDGQPGLFPNARLLVMREEWVSAHALTPPQADWYCPGGVAGIAADKVILLDQSVLIGDGLALIRTPGHTLGNHSFVAHTPDGLLVTSENGVGPDTYAPENSRIPGLKAYAKATGAEVILNGNTQEGGLEQYISMVVEKTIAGPSPRHPGFPNIVSSSELSAFWLFLGYRPSCNVGSLEFGQLHLSH